ncbi:MAG: glycosyltransferase [Anaerolineaceae bacterium]|nr:glycosyltransferase [Anaerolineaceae bacterium]
MTEQYTPSVSIITPSFNQADYLEETIQSVLSQNYSDMEYLIVDGGSTDGSVKIIERYADQLDWWVSESDEGQSDGINKGFRKATGDIVCWVNSDDVLMPGAIERAIKVFDEHPDAVMVYGDVYSIDETGKTFNKMKYGDWKLKDLMQFSIIGQPAVFMRRESIRASGYLDISFQFLMDHHLWLRLAQEGEIVHVHEFLAKARYHAEAKNIAQAANFGVEAFRLVGWMRSQPVMSGLMKENDFWKKVEAGAHRFNARYQLDAGLAMQAFREYRKSFSLSPGVALKEWHRWLFSGMSICGLGFLGKIFYAVKSKS